MRSPAAVATIVGIAILAALAAVSAALSASGYKVTATMTPRQVVTPANKPARFPSSLAKAKGTFDATTSADGLTLSWKLTYSNVGKPALVVADIHIGKPGKFGPVLVRVCGPCKASQRGTTKLKPGYAKGLAAGNNWITLITEKYPNGLVRGQIHTR